MSTEDPTYVKVWRFDHGREFPEEVMVLPVSHDYVLVKGADHTEYRGGFFDTAEKAYERKLEETERWIRSATRDRDRLLAARDRFRSGDWVGGKKKKARV